MSGTSQSIADGGNVNLTKLELRLIVEGASRCGVSEREWLRGAVVHYDRWQQLWAGPIGPRGGHEDEVELFATLAENASTCLHGRWRLLHDIVRMNSSLWVWPTESLDEYEGGVEPTLPYLDRVALRKAWPRLRELVHEVTESPEEPTAETSRV
jgi:hypothetical protein